VSQNSAQVGWGDRSKPVVPASEFVVTAAKTFGGKSRPTEGFKTPLWDFVQSIRAHPEFRWSDENDILERVEKYLQVGTARVDVWEHLFNASAEDARTEFLAIWNRIKFPTGIDRLALAVERAQPRKPIRDIPVRLTDGYYWMLAVGYELQMQMRHPDDYIFLIEEKLAALRGVTAMTVSNWRRFAVEDGLLTEVAPSTMKGTKRVGTRFKFDVERYRHVMGFDEDLPF
jgi:hypothetical protein